MSTLKIPNEIYAQMLDQARAETPIEACGMLAGSEGKVTKLYRMTNADASSDHFMMTPEQQFAVVKDIRAEGLAMLAIYHSHPETPARPSEEDIRLALTPDVIYVIVSLADETPVVKGFLIEIDNDSVTEVPVTVEEGSQ
jgi:[CysO sulfur-carrier protein]-S-L-cysteine hydrolase